MNSFSEKHKFIFGKIFSYFLVIYTFVMFGRAVWINWQLKTQIKRIETEIIKMQEQNKNLENLILYYKSESFKEVEARRKLGLKKPEEKIYSLINTKNKNFSEEFNEKKDQVSIKETDKKRPNSQLWLDYLFNQQ